MSLRIAMIGHVGNSILVRGGLEVLVEELSDALRRRGHIVYSRINENNLQSPPDIFQFVGAFYGVSDAFIKSKGIPRAVMPILLHSDLKMYKLRNYIEIVRSLIPGSVYHCRAKMLREAEQVIVNSNFEAAEAKRWGANKIRVIPAGITLNKFRSNYLPINILPEEYHQDAKFLKKADYFVVSVGRFERRKNQLNIYKACKEINIPLLLIGRRSKIEYSCIDEIIDYSSGNLFVWENAPLSALKWAYSNSLVHVLATGYETTGLVSLEAAVGGSRPVTLDYPTAREYIQPYGEIAKNSSVNSLKEAIITASNRGRLNSIEKESLKRFDLDNIAKEMELLYLKMI